MPPLLSSVVDPARCAVLVLEMQRGVVGDLATLPVLAEAVTASDMVQRLARLLEAARRAGVRVVHCTAEWRADRAGSSLRAPLLANLSRNPAQILSGTPAVEVIPELAVDERDLVSVRLHGLTPFTATSLDIWLRNLGVTTVVATGVSVNVGIVGMCIEASNLGYEIVVPTDAVCGIPASYAEDVLRNTISMVGRLSTVDEVISAWS